MPMFHDKYKVPKLRVFLVESTKVFPEITGLGEHHGRPASFTHTSHAGRAFQARLVRLFTGKFRRK